MFTTESEVAIILVISIKQAPVTPAEYDGTLAGVCGKMTIECDRDDLEGVG